MIKKITSILTVLFSANLLNAQIIFTDNFTSPWNPATLGWTIINNSQPVGTTSVFQGNGAATFPAYNGAADDYVGFNYNNVASQGGISTWLITPSLTLSNGLVLEFATRISGAGQIFPDRLQVRMSPVNSNVIPSGTTSIGTFTSLLLDINPNLTSNTSSVVINNVVNGYPSSWAIYTVAVSGLAAPVSGRFAFRYFVNDGGLNGLNSDYIGLDAVKISIPCLTPTIYINQSALGVCSGNSVALTAYSSGTNGAITYTWSSGQVTSNAIVTPTLTTFYTVSGTNLSNCIGTQTVVITVTATPNVIVPSYTVCPASSLTLVANGANTYSWNTGSTNPSIVISPNATTIYTVTGYAVGGICANVKTSTITIGAQLSINIVASSTNICSGNVVTLTAISAASNYSWNTGATAPSITVAPSSPSVYVVGGLIGLPPNFCTGTNSLLINVNASPNLSVSLSPACIGSSITILASGANSYTYLSSSANPQTILSPSVAGAYYFILSGANLNGCKVSDTIDFNVNALPVIQVVASKTIACINDQITLTASGGDSYLWSGALTSTSNPLTYSTGTIPGNKTFSVVGTASTGCSAFAVKTISVSLCTNIVNANGNLIETSAYPNPFVNELKIDGLNGSIELYNALGQVVFASKILMAESINTTDLDKGMYILKAYNVQGQELKTIKLMKN